MINKDIYSLAYINRLREKYQKDPALLERVLYAFGLLEAIVRTGMPLIFKGGTSLMLLLDHPQRLSTDIDILVPPGTDVVKYIQAASQLFPFSSFEEDYRLSKNKIEKRHFKFIYHSPLRNNEFYILLDVVFASSPYSVTASLEIKNELLLTQGQPIKVSVPTVECILADKLTAFAPHTTGVPFGVNKNLEIVKQLFDIATLSNIITDYSSLAQTYHKAVRDEIGYRNSEITEEDVLKDTIRSTACIIGKGVYYKDEYPLFLNGIRSIRGHIISINYNASLAAEQACHVMYLAACLLTDNEYIPVDDPLPYIGRNISQTPYRKLSYMRRQNAEAFSYLCKALELLNNNL